MLQELGVNEESFGTNDLRNARSDGMQKERLSFLTVCVAKNGGRPRKRKEERERESGVAPVSPQWCTDRSLAELR